MTKNESMLTSPPSEPKPQARPQAHSPAPAAETGLRKGLRPEGTDRADGPKQQLTFMHQITACITHPLDTDRVIHQMLQLMSEWLGLNQGRVLLANATRTQISIRHAYGLTGADKARGCFRRGEGLTGQVFATGQVCIVQDIDAEPAYLTRTIERSRLPTGTVAFLAVPIRQGRQVIGVLACNRLRNHARSLNDDLDILRTVAGLIGQRLWTDAARAADNPLTPAPPMGPYLEDTRSVQPLRLRGLIGQSAAVRTCIQQLERLGPTDITVLVQGESGTGKTHFAKALHEASLRHHGPFVTVNCAAIPDSLFEAELYGQETGPFDGTPTRQMGHAERAHGGTLFLDEISEIPFAQQGRLLRLLQDRMLVRVGGTREIPLDIRVVAATHRNLAEDVAAGRFRADLFYRLSVVTLTLPPLRSREADIAPLVSDALRHANAQSGRHLRLSSAALEQLRRHTWPGNIRELQNLVTRMSLMSTQDEIGANEVAALLAGTSPAAHTREQGERPYQSAHSHSREALAQAIRQARGNKSAAARALGMTRRQLLYRLSLLEDETS